MKTRLWILTAFGKDRPGIVAHVTQVLYARGCNLEDSAMTRLAGEFAIMLTFSAPGRLSQAQLHAAFQAVSKRLALVIHLKPLAAAERQARRVGSPYGLSVYGADRRGIVYRVADALSRLGVNITDVSTHLSAVPSRTGQAGRVAHPATKAAAKPLYLMVLEVELPRRLSASRLEHRLQTLAEQLGIRVSLRSAEAHVL